jgi:hypothetical protein
MIKETRIVQREMAKMVENTRNWVRALKEWRDNVVSRGSSVKNQ